jgi:adenylate kinase
VAAESCVNGEAVLQITVDGAVMDSSDQNGRAAWLQGSSAECIEVTEPLEHPWRLALLGAPGAGKGTQASLLTRQLGACHLSTGELFRQADNGGERRRTLAMSAALNLMRQGSLVPDSILWEMIRERTSCLRCRGGFVLDGFPRSLAQAQVLKALLESEKLSLDAVVNYELPVAEIVARLSGRRTCEKCQAIFHTTAQPPRTEGVCDHCGSALYQREDDRPEAIAVRLEAYAASTAPLIQFYRKLGLLITVVATESPETICARTIAALERRSRPTVSPGTQSLARMGSQGRRLESGTPEVATRDSPLPAALRGPGMK